MNAVSIRGEWVGRKIDGKFPLIAWLGGSGSTGVFLTEIANQSQVAADNSSSPPGPFKAAIKLVVASPQSEDRLAIWNLTATLSHPHVARIFQTGRAEIDETLVAYAVFELAEEILAQIIPERALTPDETREMLAPVLDALAYLHSREYVHTSLRPSNILVINNEIKLSSDSLLIAGTHAGEDFSNELHNAPEISSGHVTPAADVWSLGVTVVETLTQQLPIWDAATDSEPDVPATLPSPFAEIVRECLHVDPERRCTLAEVRELLEGKAQTVVPPPEAEPVPLAAPPSQQLEERQASRKIPLVPIIVGFVLLVAIIIGLLMRHHETHVAPVQTEATQQASPAEPGSAGQAAQGAANASAPAEVVHRAIPDVPHFASNTIRGVVVVSVRIAVDKAGSVSNAELATRGPSAYFARLALESARDWKFKPAQKDGAPVASVWMLHYEFRRDGVVVKPAQIEPRE